MPETPDFDQIAEQAITAGTIADDDEPRTVYRRHIAEQLRLVWNARGAADGEALKAELQRAWTWTPEKPDASRPTIHLEQMIKALDR